MDTLEILNSIGERNNGEVFLGVVGPVRVGKSSFVKRFMEVLILDNIDNEEEKKRVIDSLPQIGEGKTIMTMEPKFVPMNGVEVKVFDSTSVKVRMIDSVGYIIDNSNGYLEDGKMRMVKTPWFSDNIPFDEASRVGTLKVIKDHSTLGMVVLSDGSCTGFDRSDYEKVEKNIIEDVKATAKPFVIILNSNTPHSDMTMKIKEELELKYNVPVISLDVNNMTREEANMILEESLSQYPLSGVELELPVWVSSLDDSHYIKSSLKDSIDKAMSEIKIMKDVDNINEIIKENEYVDDVEITNIDTNHGVVTIKVSIKDELYNKVLEELVGSDIHDRGQLIKVLSEFSRMKKDYALIGNALEMANSTGYGFASSNRMNICEPKLSKVQGRHAIKVKASTCCYHVIKVEVGANFEPVLGSKEQADYFLDYLMNAYEKGEEAMLECELFGRKFKDILQEAVSSKLNNLPEQVKIKLQQIIKTISNKGKGNLIAFVF